MLLRLDPKSFATGLRFVATGPHSDDFCSDEYKGKIFLQRNTLKSFGFGVAIRFAFKPIEAQSEFPTVQIPCSLALAILGWIEHFVYYCSDSLLSLHIRTTADGESPGLRSTYHGLSTQIQIAAQECDPVPMLRDFQPGHDNPPASREFHLDLLGSVFQRFHELDNRVIQIALNDPSGSELLTSKGPLGTASCLIGPLDPRKV